jgi:leucyl aminopeptidase (aminopeptidase T)
MMTWNHRFSAHILIAAIALTTMAACRSEGPRLTVAAPAQSSHFTRGDTVHFVAELNSDLDFGVIDQSAWQWESDKDGQLGRGPRVDTPNLSVGEHHVTATVPHKLGVSSAQVTVFVD